MPLFSIIIPVYNVQEYLAACVKSVAEQEGPRDWECLLVDDGSTDMCPQLCDAFAAEIPASRSSTAKTADWPPPATPACKLPPGTGCCFWTATTPWPRGCWRRCAGNWPTTRGMTGISANTWNGCPTAP